MLEETNDCRDSFTISGFLFISNWGAIWMETCNDFLPRVEIKVQLIVRILDL